MQTMNVHCRACRGLIAVSREDLGHEVQCPLCQQVIVISADAAPSSPPPPPAPAEPPTVDMSPFELSFISKKVRENESIFAAPEDVSDDVFGVASAPKLELPSTRSTIVPPPPPQLAPPTVVAPAAPASVAAQQFVVDIAALPSPSDSQAPTLRSKLAPLSDHILSPLAPPPEDDGQPLRERSGPAAEVLQRAQQGRGLGTLTMVLLIFLVPYACFTTVFIGYLLWQQRANPSDPLERMLDYNPKDGGPKRIQHDLPLPPKLRTWLHKPIRVGALELEPIKVEKTTAGDLRLQVRMRSLAEQYTFNPMPKAFAVQQRGSMTALRPYTYLEFTDKQEKRARRIYGGAVQWWMDVKGRMVEDTSGVLHHKDQVTTMLTTEAPDRKLVAMLLGTDTRMLWRLHVRRGLETIREREVSVTCVVGIELDARSITQAPPDPDDDD